MNRQLDCEIVRDLLPSYLDGQTSDVTNTAIEEHISWCRDCAEVLQRMKEPEDTAVPQYEEIDYLKKVKRSKKRTAWTAAAATLLIVLLILGIVLFVRGTAEDLNAHAVNVRVEGDTVFVSGSLVSSGEGVARIVFTEEDGVVDVRLFTAPSAPFNSGSFSEKYTSNNGPVTAVTSSGIVIWENGEAVSHLAGMLFAEKNPYIGDMPANNRIADVIGIRERYGSYKNELKTSAEPYRWVIILEDPVDPAHEARIKQRMSADACLMIAAVENLGTVTWRYENGSGQQEFTITELEASEIAGADIKRFAESASGMQKLVETVW